MHWNQPLLLPCDSRVEDECDDLIGGGELEWSKEEDLFGTICWIGTWIDIEETGLKSDRTPPESPPSKYGNITNVNM